MMKVNCLCCGHQVNLHEAYDDYEGLVKCFACGGILKIKTTEGKLQSADFVARPRAVAWEEIGTKT